MSKPQRGEAIRLTNKTAKSLRQQAKQQKMALYVAALVFSVAMCVLAVMLGMQHIIAVPVTVLLTIAADSLILMLARGRYLSLTGQAICTEAAARQMRERSDEEKRAGRARRDLAQIKRDLGLEEETDAPVEDAQEGEEDDEDLFRPVQQARPQVYTAREEQPAQATKHVEPVTRRRRQARLQVISNDLPDDQAN